MCKNNFGLYRNRLSYAAALLLQKGSLTWLLLKPETAGVFGQGDVTLSRAIRLSTTWCYLFDLILLALIISLRECGHVMERSMFTYRQRAQHSNNSVGRNKHAFLIKFKH